MTIAEFKNRNAEAQAFNVKIQQARGAIEENKRQFEQLCAEYKAQYGEDVNADNIEALLNKVTAELERQVVAQERAIAEARESIYKVADTGVTDEGNADDVGTTEMGTAAETVAPAAMPTPAPIPAPAAVAPAPVAPVAVAPTPAPVAPVAPVAPAPVAVDNGEVTLGAVAAPEIAPVPTVKVAMPGGIVAPTAPAPVVVPAAPAAAVAAANEKSRFIKPVMPGNVVSMGDDDDDAPKPAKVSMDAINNASMMQQGMPDVLSAPTAPAAPAAQPTVQSPWGGTGANADFTILGGKFGG